MIRIRLFTFLACAFMSFVYGQQLTQTLRGTVLDTDSRLPLAGVDVLVAGIETPTTAVTDDKGTFTLDRLPIGRVSLTLLYEGYEDLTMSNIEVSSGKEVVLNIQMQESITRMETVVISSEKNKGEAQNEMSLISARSISMEESKRYAGSFNDPARILSNFAGVSSSDASNDIIVRGNSPKYMQWRLEGVEITNPNHFADQNAVAGTVNALNNNLLSSSDFQTGAFSPEYGDVLSGVYDVSLRPGNNKTFESALGVGILGTDLTLEGPFKKGYDGAFLVNYRYSNTTLIDKLGIANAGGVPKFQDMAFKVTLPTRRLGHLSLFGLGGLSGFTFKDVKPGIWPTPTNRSMYENISEDYSKKAHLANVGVNHTLNLNERSFVKSSLSYSSYGIDEEIIETKTVHVASATPYDSIASQGPSFNSALHKESYRLGLAYHNKLSAKSKIQVGVKYALLGYNYAQRQPIDTSGTFNTIDFKEHASTMRSYISWKHRFTRNVTLVAGLHHMQVLLNNKGAIEPRLALKWQLSAVSALQAGYGKHSTMETIHNYFSKVKRDDGTVVMPNKDLGLLKAHHFVLGYEARFTKNLVFKSEAYYQHLYNLPVENNDTSYYATINEGLQFRYVDLVNSGTGKNYGVELTLERFFNKNYYFLINGSLYQSKYKSLEGKERNSMYNGNYMFNILCGKEFQKLGKKKNQVLNINARAYFGGGKKIIPLLRNTDGDLAVNPTKGQFWDYKKAYEHSLEDTYQIILSVSYKWNRPKTTHEIYFNLDNLTNNHAKISEYYDESLPSKIGYVKQFGLLPNFMYRVYF